MPSLGILRCKIQKNASGELFIYLYIYYRNNDILQNQSQSRSTPATTFTPQRPGSQQPNRQTTSSQHQMTSSQHQMTSSQHQMPSVQQIASLPPQNVQQQLPQKQLQALLQQAIVNRSQVFMINCVKNLELSLILYDNVTGWCAITEKIARGEAEDNYLIWSRTSTSGIRVLLTWRVYSKVL